MPDVSPVVQGLTEIQGNTRPMRDGDTMKTNGLLARLVRVGVGASYAAPAAKSNTNVVAATAGNTAVGMTVAGQPDMARNLQYVFALGYDGGNITVVGTDQFGNAVSETIVAVPNSTVTGTVVFKTVTSATRSAVGATANTVSIGQGDRLGITDAVLAGAYGILAVSGVTEAATFTVLTNSVLPGTSVPNGARTYLVHIPV